MPAYLETLINNIVEIILAVPNIHGVEGGS